jgi:hypothetical protein
VAHVRVADERQRACLRDLGIDAGRCGCNLAQVAQLYCPPGSDEHHLHGATHASHRVGPELHVGGHAVSDTNPSRAPMARNVADLEDGDCSRELTGDRPASDLRWH